MSYDALMVVSFGGPEGPDEVMPFLQRVTAGRGVPPERLQRVAGQYLALGGVSPINAQNRALVSALSSRLGGRMPVYWGNRNWKPLLADEVARMRGDGVARAVAFATSAYSSYSGCRQYQEDIAGARLAVGQGAPAIDKLPVFWDRAEWVQVWVESLAAALAETGGSSVPVLFSAHSLPSSMAATSDYQAQLEATAARVADGAGVAPDGWQLVWQSRSGGPGQPWLGPDVGDAIAALPPGVGTVVVAPIGFVSDHMEVVYDLDTVAAAVASARGTRMVRAATPGTHPLFVGMITTMVDEALAGDGVAGCAAGCCPAPGPARRP